MQCTYNSRRSVLDMYYLTKAKFKNIRLPEVVAIMLEMTGSKNCAVCSIYCGDVKKFVFKNYDNYGLQAYNFDVLNKNRIAPFAWLCSVRVLLISYKVGNCYA